ncbi:hypothetical protein R6Q57_021006 [Mikania cordata]
MAAGSPATLTTLISLSILLLWCITTPILTTNGRQLLKHEQDDRRYRSLSARRALTSRNTLAPTTKFDFAPFIHVVHHHHRHQHQHQHQGSTIDPRYGVEMRRVPSGPNPLHH